MINIEEITKDVEPLIRERVRVLIIRKLALWNSSSNLSDIISEETENFMKIIRPALYRIGKENEWL